MCSWGAKSFPAILWTLESIEKFEYKRYRYNIANSNNLLWINYKYTLCIKHMYNIHNALNNFYFYILFYFIYLNNLFPYNYIICNIILFFTPLSWNNKSNYLSSFILSRFFFLSFIINRINFQTLHLFLWHTYFKCT